MTTAFDSAWLKGLYYKTLQYGIEMYRPNTINSIQRQIKCGLV